MILHGAAIGTVNAGAENIEKELYKQNHHMMLAQAQTMKLCHEMCPKGKIGPAPNISAIYPATSKPEDILAATINLHIRNWLYLDMAVYGRYNAIAWSYMVEKGIEPTIEDGDMEILKGGNPDFIAFNYYCTGTALKVKLMIRMQSINSRWRSTNFNWRDWSFQGCTKCKSTKD